MIGVGTWEPTEKTRQLLKQVLDSGRISYGPLCKELEARFAKLHGCKYAVLSNSGTDALRIALQALKEHYGWRNGDEVIVPAVTFVATVNIVIQCGMTPVLVDIDPLYYELDPEKIVAAITPKTRAVIPVHLFGQPCDMTAIMQIAQAHDLRVLEDSCECMFATHAGQSTGSFGDVAGFSMYVAHLLTAGIGGISTTNDPTLAARMRSLVNHGRDGIYISIDDNKAELEQISRRFHFKSIGYSARITELEAAVALPQLDTWPEMIATRQMNAAYLTLGLEQVADVLQLPTIRPQTEHVFMMYPLVLKRGDKFALCQYLEEHGVETREMLPLTNQPVYSTWCNEDDYPVAKRINRQGFYVGCHQGLKVEDLDKIIDALYSWVKTKGL